MHSTYAEEGLLQVGATLRHDSPEGLDHLPQGFPVAHIQPLPRSAGQQRTGFDIEDPDLILGVAGEPAEQPFRPPQGLRPLGRVALAFIPHVAKTDDIDDGVVQHAGGAIQQDEQAFAPQFQPCDIFPVALPHQPQGLIAGFRDLRFQALFLLLQLLDVQLQPVQFHRAELLREAFRQGARLLRLFHDAPRHAFRNRQLFINRRDVVAGPGQVPLAGEDLLFQLRDFRRRVPVVNRRGNIDIHIVLDDEKQQRRRTEAAGHDVQERQAKRGQLSSGPHLRP